MSSGLICFEALSQLHQVSVDLRAIQREYGLQSQELKPEELVRIARNNGFKCKIKRNLSIEKMGRNYPLPTIAALPNGQFLLLLKVNIEDKKVLCFLPLEKKTQEWTFEELTPRLSLTWLILYPKLFNPQVRFGFTWFYQEIMQYKKIIAEVLTGSFFVQLFGLITPLFTQVILDKVIVHHSLTTLDVLAVAFVAIVIFQFLLNITRNYIFTHTANKIDAKLGAKLFKHLFALPFSYFESRKVGNIISRIRELENIREFITNKSVSLIIDLFFSLVFVVMMLLYSVSLTLIVLVCVGVIALLYAVVTPQFRRRLDDKFQMSAQSNSYLVETVTGVQTVKSLAIEGTMQRKWEDYLGQYLQSSFNLSKLSHLANTVSGLFQQCMTIAILYFGVRLVISNELTIGQLIAFNMFAGQFTNPILRLVNLWNEFQQALLAVDRLGDILNQPQEVQTSQAITLAQLKGEVRFENIAFRYAPGSPWVVKDVSLNIEPNQMIGLVGRSGSGKSTLTKLIQRLYLPQEGAIYIDGIDTRHISPLWLRYNIGVVLQDSYLFSGTIRENIALPRPEANMEAIIQACELAGAHEFIVQFPEGYDTFVGERGSSLSGGQRQRLAIARSLITNPRILIFDEATSALDYESERVIRQSIQRLRAGRTIIMIAHRLSTIQDCDWIVAMDKGQIVESGSHDVLMSQRGYYYDLHQQQERANGS